MSSVKATVTVDLDVQVHFTDEDLKQACQTLQITKHTKGWREQAVQELVQQHVVAILRGEHAKTPGSQSPEDHGIEVVQIIAEKVSES
jgi:hypothetical protein